MEEAVIVEEQVSSDIFQKDKTQEFDYNDKTDTAVKSQPKFVSINRTKAEDFLMVLEETLAKVQLQKENIDKLLSAYEKRNEDFEKYQSKIISVFDTVTDRLRSLQVEIDKSGSYENYLEERVKNSDLTKSVTMLERQLQNEKVEFMTFIHTAEQKINYLKNADEILVSATKDFVETVEGSKQSFIGAADAKLDEISKEMGESTKAQVDYMRGKADEMLKKYTEKCQQHLDTLKKDSIDFLTRCSEQNEKLVKNVPAVKGNRYGWKDKMLVAMCFVTLCLALIGKFF